MLHDSRLLAQVLPAEAHASIVARLVAAQTPAGAYAALEAHLLASAAALFPPGVANVTVERLGFSAAPVVAPAASLANAAASEVLTEMYGAAPFEKRMGGSIPAVGYIKQVRTETTMPACLSAAAPLIARADARCRALRAQHLGIDTTGLAFGHPGCGAHAPDEHLALRDLRRNQDAYAAILFRIARIAAEERAAALGAAWRSEL